MLKIGSSNGQVDALFNDPVSRGSGRYNNMVQMQYSSMRHTRGWDCSTGEPRGRLGRRDFGGGIFYKPFPLPFFFG
jgi:hypothetical protein